MKKNLLQQISSKLSKLPPSTVQSIPVKKTIPPHKIIEGTLFAVDAFSYGEIPKVTHYFLTHFHYDHYCGLTKHFKGKIVCSKITSNLLQHVLGVDPTNIEELEYGDNTIDGINVQVIDANHCPGAILLIFNDNILHTGDFRVNDAILSNPLIKTTNFERIYLDNTYLNRTDLDFPTQEESIQDVINIILNTMASDQQRLVPIKYLIMTGTYTIGKEKLFIKIAEMFDFKIYAENDKRKILNCLEWEDLNSLLVDDPKEAQLHIVGMSDLNQESISVRLDYFYPHFTHVIAFKPTGWAFTGREYKAKELDHVSKDRLRKKCIQVFNVPYSEHSSHFELQKFIQSVSCNEIIHTV